jgi:proteasome accessory factor C
LVPLPPTIAEALDSRKPVRMHYVDARGQTTHRSVRPLRVTARRGYLYLIAHCYRAGELRTFRLDRVVDMSIDESAE